MHTTTTLQKVGARGQITLPKSWRDAHPSELVRVKATGGVIEVVPVEATAEDDVVWSAVRDNDGKGIPVDDFVNMLDSIIASKKR
jgi:bifunctional DNA-binding transcriptional regulator/antitoxin component of YhaV-PrlF toxin-antitoxin module